MARNPSAQAMADAWSTGVANSGAKLTAGVNAVTESPTVAAARNIDGYLQGVQNAVSSGRMVAKLMASPVTKWKNGMMTKAKNNLATAAANGKPAYQTFASSWAPAMAAASAAADAIPKNDRAGQLARVNAVLDAAAAWKASH